MPDSSGNSKSRLMPIFALHSALGPTCSRRSPLCRRRKRNFRRGARKLVAQALPHWARRLHAVRHDRAKCRASRRDGLRTSKLRWISHRAVAHFHRLRRAERSPARRHSATRCRGGTFHCQGEDHRRSVACLHPAKNPLARRESADGLVKATRASYDASLARFDQGLVPVQDVLPARAAAVSSHRAARGIGQRHRSDSRGIGFRFRQARSRYPPRPIATPVSSAPTMSSTPLNGHSGNDGELPKAEVPGGDRRTDRNENVVGADLVAQSRPFKHGLIKESCQGAFGSQSSWCSGNGRMRGLLREELQASQHALPLCSTCVSKLVPRIGGPPELLEFLKGHWRALVRLDDVLGEFLGRL